MPRAVRSLLAALCLGILPAADEADRQQAFRAAVLADDTATALAICTEALAAASAAHGLWWAHRGLLAARAEDAVTAVDAFRRARSQPDHFFDPQLSQHFLRSLLELRLYHQARAEADRIVMFFPAASDADQAYLAVALEDRGRDRLGSEALTYLRTDLRRQVAAQRHGLCLVVAEELLAFPSSEVPTEVQHEARLYGGLAAVRLRDWQRAEALLVGLPATYAEGRAGLGQVLLQLGLGRVAAAQAQADALLAESGMAAAVVEHLQRIVASAVP